MANCERRELLPGLPFGGERSGPARVAVEIPFVVGEGEGAVGTTLEQEAATDPQYEQIHVAVAVDVERIGADDVAQEFGVSADVERPLFELERPASLGFVDEQSRRILTPREEHRGKARAVAIERRSATADEELPRTVVDAVEAGGFRLFMHEGHVAQRLLPVLAGTRPHQPDEKREDAEDDPHHCASMTSDRRNAMTPSRFSGSSAMYASRANRASPPCAATISSSMRNEPLWP